VVESTLGQLSRMAVEFDEILHEHQGILTLIHHDTVDFFAIVGVIR
jgi:hypothetical protein